MVLLSTCFSRAINLVTSELLLVIVISVFAMLACALIPETSEAATPHKTTLKRICVSRTVFIEENSSIFKAPSRKIGKIDAMDRLYLGMAWALETIKNSMTI